MNIKIKPNILLLCLLILVLFTGCSNNQPVIIDSEEKVEISTEPPKNEITVYDEQLTNFENVFLKITVNEGCVSCHLNNIYITQDDKIIFNAIREDVDVVKIDQEKTEITIKTPIRKDGEPYCCPSEYVEETITCDDDLICAIIK